MFNLGLFPPRAAHAEHKVIVAPGAATGGQGILREPQEPNLISRTADSAYVTYGSLSSVEAWIVPLQSDAVSPHSDPPSDRTG
jgi:hypothetical protein